MPGVLLPDELSVLDPSWRKPSGVIIAFHHRIHSETPCAESNHKTLGRTAGLDRDQVAANYAVANSWRCSRTGLHCGKTHGLDIRNHVSGDEGAKLHPVSSSSAVGGVVGALRSAPI